MKAANLTRRGFFGNLALGTALTSFIAREAGAAQTPAAPSGPFSLPPLHYAFDALEPHIDAKTMEIHHDKHHQAYVDKVNAALDEVMKGRTTFVIAHRLTTIQKADIILVMGEGRLVETGTHEQLIRLNGLYAHLHALQFQDKA